MLLWQEQKIICTYLMSRRQTAFLFMSCLANRKVINVLNTQPQLTAKDKDIILHLNINTSNTSVQKMSSSTPFISPDIEFQTAPVSDYTIGSIIKHTNLGICKIIDITEIKKGVNIIKIRFSDNRIDKLPLESVVESNLIMIGII